MSARRLPGSLSGWARLLALAAIILAAMQLSDAVLAALDLEMRPSNETRIHRLIMTGTGVYALLLAVPFVPGAEIGLALLGMFGPPIAPLVYLATVAGLSLAYMVGRLIPAEVIASALGNMDLARASELVTTLAPLDGPARMELLAARAPGRLVPILLRYRYPALAVLLNIPGNVVVGGGGGIALAAGLSRIYTTPMFLVTVAPAVAPVPLAVAALGVSVGPS